MLMGDYYNEDEHGKNKFDRLDELMNKDGLSSDHQYSSRNSINPQMLIPQPNLYSDQELNFSHSQT